MFGAPLPYDSMRPQSTGVEWMHSAPGIVQQHRRHSIILVCLFLIIFVKGIRRPGSSVSLPAMCIYGIRSTFQPNTYICSCSQASSLCKCAGSPVPPCCNLDPYVRARRAYLCGDMSRRFRFGATSRRSMY